VATEILIMPWPQSGRTHMILCATSGQPQVASYANLYEQQLKAFEIRTSRSSRKMMLAGEEVEEERQNEVDDIS
jgi:hypothetical protein